MKPFWMVYGVGCGAPTVRHDTEACASREADRLARSAPGTTFVVLEAVTAVRKNELQRFDLRPGSERSAHGRDAGEIDDIPF